MPRPGPAFSNGTEGEMWDVNWCDRCLVDAPFRRNLSKTGCGLLLTALFGEIPDEWIEQPEDHYPSDAYHCINFKPFGWRDPEPKPQPTPPGQGELFARDEAAGTRMLTQAPSEVSA